MKGGTVVENRFVDRLLWKGADSDDHLVLSWQGVFPSNYVSAPTVY